MSVRSRNYNKIRSTRASAVGFIICTVISNEAEFSDEVERPFRNETPFNFGRKSGISCDTLPRVRICKRTHTHSRVKGGIPVLDDVAPTSASFYDLRAMRQTPRFTFTLYIYIYTTALCPRNFIRACRLRSRNFHIKVSAKGKEGVDSKDTGDEGQG